MDCRVCGFGVMGLGFGFSVSGLWVRDAPVLELDGFGGSGSSGIQVSSSQNAGPLLRVYIALRHHSLGALPGTLILGTTRVELCNSGLRRLVIWVAVKELEVRYYNKETYDLLYTRSMIT